MSSADYLTCPECNSGVGVFGKCRSCHKRLSYTKKFNSKINITFLIYVAIKVVGSFLIIGALEPEQAVAVLIYFIWFMLGCMLCTVLFLMFFRAQFELPKSEI